jgi:hypothetical protein
MRARKVQAISRKSGHEALPAERVQRNLKLSDGRKDNVLRWIQCCDGDTEIYLIANAANCGKTLVCTFRGNDNVVGLPDAVTVERYFQLAYPEESRCPTIPLAFAPDTSVFIHFTKGPERLTQKSLLDCSIVELCRQWTPAINAVRWLPGTCGSGAVAANTD